MMPETEAVVPIVVHMIQPNKVEIEIPDLHITTHGDSFMEAMAWATQASYALHIYGKTHNVELPIKHTLSDMEQLCRSKKDFVTCILLTEGDL